MKKYLFTITCLMVILTLTLPVGVLTAQVQAAAASDPAVSNTYVVENQWGGNDAPWHSGGRWVIGGRSDQRVVALNVTSDDGGQTLFGAMTYAGEGPIGFRATRTAQNTYVVENQWGGNDAPWHPGGTWILGGRSDQNVIAIDISSNDGGVTLTGAMTYAGEGPIGFRAAHCIDPIDFIYLPIIIR